MADINAILRRCNTADQATLQGMMTPTPSGNAARRVGSSQTSAPNEWRFEGRWPDASGGEKSLSLDGPVDNKDTVSANLACFAKLRDSARPSGAAAPSTSLAADGGTASAYFGGEAHANQPGSAAFAVGDGAVAGADHGGQATSFASNGGLAKASAHGGDATASGTDAGSIARADAKRARARSTAEADHGAHATATAYNGNANAKATGTSQKWLGGLFGGKPSRANAIAGNGTAAVHAEADAKDGEVKQTSLYAE
jgi:hypothetical protein